MRTARPGSRPLANARNPAEASLETFAGLASLDPEAGFNFACHPAIACFNVCCSDVDILLGPYDVLRLRHALQVSGTEFLGRFAEVDRARGTRFPLVSLRMNADAIGACPFVRPSGCSVYADRPAACRCYPVGRLTEVDDDGRIGVRFGLIREQHCRGFGEAREHRVADWLAEQGLADYITFADRHLRLFDRVARRRQALAPNTVTALLEQLYLGRDGLRDGISLAAATAQLARAFDDVESELFRS